MLQQKPDTIAQELVVRMAMLLLAIIVVGGTAFSRTPWRVDRQGAVISHAVSANEISEAQFVDAMQGLRALGGATLTTKAQGTRFIVAEGARVLEYVLPLTSTAAPVRSSPVLPGVVEDVVIVGDRVVVTCRAFGVLVLFPGDDGQLTIVQSLPMPDIVDIAAVGSRKLLIATRSDSLADYYLDDAGRLEMQAIVQVSLSPDGMGRSIIEHVAVSDGVIAVSGNVSGASGVHLALLRITSDGSIHPIEHVELPQRLVHLEASNGVIVGETNTLGIVVIAPAQDEDRYDVRATFGEDIFDRDTLAFDVFESQIAAVTVDSTGGSTDWVLYLIDVSDPSNPDISGALDLGLEPRNPSFYMGLPTIVDPSTIVVSAAGLWSYSTDWVHAGMERQASIRLPGSVHDAVVVGDVGFVATDSGIWRFDPENYLDLQFLSPVLTEDLHRYEDGIAYIDDDTVVAARLGTDGELIERARFVDENGRSPDSIAADGARLFVALATPRGGEGQLVVLDMRGPDVISLGTLSSDLSIDIVNREVLASRVGGGVMLVDVRDPSTMQPIGLVETPNSQAIAGLAISGRRLFRTLFPMPGQSVSDTLDVTSFDLDGNWNVETRMSIPEGVLGALAVGHDRIVYGEHGGQAWTTELGISRIDSDGRMVREPSVALVNTGSPVGSLEISGGTVLASTGLGGMLAVDIEPSSSQIYIPWAVSLSLRPQAQTRLNLGEHTARESEGRWPLP